MAKLTNAHPLISDYPFATREPEIGTLDYEGIKAQVVDLPSIGAEEFDIGIVHTADLIIIVIDNLNDLEKISPLISKSSGKTLIAINKSDIMENRELRKLEDKIKSLRLNAIVISSLKGVGLDSLKDAIFRSMCVIRIYLKEPGKLFSPSP